MLALTSQELCSGVGVIGLSLAHAAANSKVGCQRLELSKASVKLLDPLVSLPMFSIGVSRCFLLGLSTGLLRVPVLDMSGPAGGRERHPREHRREPKLCHVAEERWQMAENRSQFFWVLSCLMLFDLNHDRKVYNVTGFAFFCYEPDATGMWWKGRKVI